MPNAYENMLAECKQREDAWRAARLGRVSSSRVGALLSQSGLYKKLLAAVAGAGLQAQDAETGAAWGDGVARLALGDATALVHFEMFVQDTGAVLFPPTALANYSNSCMRSGLDREAATKIQSIGKVARTSAASQVRV